MDIDTTIEITTVIQAIQVTGLPGVKGDQGIQGTIGVDGQQGTAGNSIAILQSFQNDELVTLYRGTPVYQSASNKIKKAKADNIITKNVIGFVSDESIPSSSIGLINCSLDQNASTLEWEGIVNNIGGLVPQTMYYLSSTSAGYMTEVMPNTVGHFICELGYALTSTRFIFKPKESYQL